MIRQVDGRRIHGHRGILAVPMNKAFDTGLVWLRRDLRVDDNAALHLALASCRHVHCAFVFDSGILDPLPRADRRVEFIR
ncbi:MAG: deoxyribodipyrimidine photo-lyase, partial [Rhodoferax sp.]|nr:deoxyribodipyrimidine photo-lyase [Rhodoferax sp.]